MKCRALISCLSLLPLALFSQSEPPADLSIERIELISATQAEITLSGPTNRVFILEYSTNLNEWQSYQQLQPDAVDPDGGAVIQVTPLASEDLGFYRALHVAPGTGELIDALEGPSAEPANLYLPELAMPGETESSIAFVNVDAPVSLHHVLAVFKDEVTVQQVNDFLSAFPAQIAGSIPVMEAVCLRVGIKSDVHQLDQTIEELKTTGLFKAVAANLGFTRPTPVDEPAPQLNRIGPEPGRVDWEWDAPPSGLGTGGNNALELSRIPQLWNWLDEGRRKVQQSGAAPITLFEFDYFLGHEDAPPNLVRTGSATSGTGNHGIGVIGVAAANGTNAIGLQGVTPLADPVRAAVWQTNSTGGHSLSGPRLGDIAAQICRPNPSRVINVSSGMPYTNNPVTATINPSSSTTMAQWMDDLGEVWANAFQSVNQKCTDRYLVVTSAGNDGVDTRYNHPIANIANIACRQSLRSMAPNFLTVENVDGNGATNPGSNRDVVTGGDTPGHAVSAGGTSVGLLSGASSSSYRRSSGTSYSAPLVSGLASLLWTLDPGLSVSQLKSLLMDAGATRAVAGSSSELVDGFAAALHIDSIRGNKAMQRALVDVDDGTMDGNLREKAHDDELSPDTIHNPGQRRGDGTIDMKDFRAFRDAYLHAVGETNYFDGATNHFKRDANFDGLIAGKPVSPSHPVDVAAATAVSSSPDEDLLSRYDFNGNGRLDPETIMNDPGPLAVAPFKTDPDDACLIRNVENGCFRDLDPLLDPDLWEVTEENVHIEGTDQLSIITSPPPAEWNRTTVHLTNYLNNFFMVDHVPYLWSCDIHLDMEAAEGGGFTVVQGATYYDGLWISNAQVLFSKGRSQEWQGVVTVPLAHPEYPIAGSPGAAPYQVTMMYQRTVGQESHGYLINLDPGPGEDVKLSLGFEVFECKSTKRDIDPEFWPRQGQNEWLVKPPDTSAPYDTQVVSGPDVFQVPTIAADMARENLLQRTQLPDILGEPSAITGIYESEQLNQDSARIDLYGIVVQY